MQAVDCIIVSCQLTYKQAMLCAFTASDSPNFLSMYPMASGTDYAEQTLSVNGIDDQVISE